MFEDKKILALIPARSGSKGLPGKNIKELNGKPLIHWTIQAAKDCSYVDSVVVSTDGNEIAKAAKESGALVPFMRPEEFSGDEATSQAVIKHALEQLKNESFDYLLYLQPTSPFRKANHITKAIEHYFSQVKSKSETLISVCPLPPKMGWIMHEQNGFLNFSLKNSQEGKQRQALSKYYLPNGALYFAPAPAAAAGFYTDQTLFLEMNEYDSLDIDTQEDFSLAEEYLRTSKTSL